MEPYSNLAPIRVWDTDHELVHTFSKDEVTFDGGHRFSRTPLDEPFARWVLGQFEPRAYMTVDGPEGRWFGELGGFVVIADDGPPVLRAGWMQRDGGAERDTDLLRSTAVLRVAKAELGMLRGWPESLDEEWEHTPEDLRGRLLLLGERVVAALDDLLLRGPAAKGNA